ncbi:insulinase family protein [Xenorhabdus sp. SF857]|uniref:M16 family metallopeptidase n=1 Tax=Xenorhabdus bakwenae TaxID=3026967 RepID=UPI0025581170|nr:insulinase family protein [Xenorhabdus sp. SF857]WFQ80775.1 insulinase family protein [Xenorhabdus sp. SF857]
MAGSRYIKRDPIGDVDTIKTVSAQRVADFYHQWYRPDNMSVIVIGDIDKQKILTMLENKLGSQPIATTKLTEIDYTIPLVAEWRSASVYEADRVTPAVEVSFFNNYQEDNGIERYRQDFANQIATRLLNIRLQRFEKENEHAINTANYFSSNIGRQTTQSVFSLQLSHDDFDQATLALFNFLAEIKQNGFSQAEFDEEVKRLAQLNEKNSKKATYSIDLAADVMVSAASQQWLIGKQDKYQLNKSLLEQLSLAEINDAFSRIIDAHSRLVLATQTSENTVPLMNKDTLSLNWEQAIKTSQPRWQQNKVKVTQLPQLDFRPGKLKILHKWDKYNITEYRLSNGSKLVYQYDDTNPGKVFFKALTQGGLRSVPTEDYHVLRIAANLVDETGFGSIPVDDLRNLFNQSPIVMATLIDDFQQGFSGWAESENVENILTLFHLKLAESSVSSKVLSKYQTEMQQQLSEDNADSQYQFTRQISALRYPGQKTIYDVNINDINTLTTDKLNDVYNKYIAQRTDYTYFIVGDIEQQQVEQLAAKYLASVRVNSDNPQLYPLYAKTPKQRLIKASSSEPRAEVELYLTMNAGWRPDDAYYLELVGELVQEQLRLKLREQASGIYSVTSWFWHNAKEPQNEGRIMFSCAPERVDEMINLTHQVLNSIAKNGIDPQVLNNTLIQSRDNINRLHSSVQGMLDLIERSYMLTDSPLLIDATLRANQEATKDKIERISRYFLENAEIFEAVLLPSKTVK